MHGLAGSAAIALVVLTIIRDPILAAAYLLLFGIGTIGGMMLITLLLTAPFVFTSVNLPRFNWQLAVASGLISFAFGLFLVYDIGFADGGLFTDNPKWATTPIGRAVQLRATWLILDLPSLEPGATFYGVTVWAKWIIDRAKTCGIRFADKATNRSPRRRQHPNDWRARSAVNPADEHRDDSRRNFGVCFATRTAVASYATSCPRNVAKT